MEDLAAEASSMSEIKDQQQALSAQHGAAVLCVIPPDADGEIARIIFEALAAMAARYDVDTSWVTFSDPAKREAFDAGMSGMTGGLWPGLEAYFKAAEGEPGAIGVANP